MASGTDTVAMPVAKLTAALTDGPVAVRLFSTRAAQAAQVIPLIARVTSRPGPSAAVPGSASRVDVTPLRYPPGTVVCAVSRFNRLCQNLCDIRVANDNNWHTRVCS